MTLPDLSYVFNVPAFGVSNDPPHLVLAQGLESVRFGVYGADGTEEKLVIGKNLFVDFLPNDYKEQDESSQEQPDEVFVLIHPEAFTMSSSAERFNQKVDSLAIIEVSCGSRDRALTDIHRFFDFFLRRENVVQFESCNLSIRHIRPLGIPVPLGEDDNHRATYSLRLLLRSISTS